MGIQLFGGKNFTLTRFWGKGKKGVMYQITQYNKIDERYDYIQLSKKDIRFIVKLIGKGDE